MKDSTFKISIRIALILTSFLVLMTLISAATFDPASISSISSSLSGFLTIAATIGAFIWAHVKIVRRDEGRIQFQDAIISSLVIISVSWFIGTCANLLSYEFFLKEPLADYYNQEYGSLISGDALQWSTMFWGYLMSLIFQIFLALMVIMVESRYFIYKKAGKNGWAAIIPFYNIIVLLEIVRKPVWWLILMFIPVVNLIVAISIVGQLAKSFGKSDGFAVGLFFLPFIFYPLLGMSDAEYQYGKVQNEEAMKDILDAGM